MRLNFVRSFYQKTSAAVLDIIGQPSSSTSPLSSSGSSITTTPHLSRERLVYPQNRCSNRLYLSSYLRNDTTPTVTFFLKLLPYALCFCIGAFLVGITLLSFDEVKPCGITLGETVLNFVADVTNNRWNTSATKYKVECPRFPPSIIGKLPYPPDHTPTYDELDKLYGPTFVDEPSSLGMGGHFKPSWCEPVSRVAIIVPYRNRDENLRVFLLYMHRIMQNQLLDYAIFIVEQAGPDSIPFNRGLLLNVGFAKAMEAYNFSCVLFYDVDKIPVDDRCSHACPSPRHVRHMAAYQDRFERMPFRDEYFGGVLAINSEDVKSLNGFSNIFFGYGYEDDEFLQRIKLQNLTIYREHEMLTHYRNLGHAGDWTGFGWRYENKNLLLTTDERIKFEGLNSVAHDGLTLLKLQSYTRIVVKISSEKTVFEKLRQINPPFYKLVAQALKS